MAIKVEDISTDITLELDEEVISIADFQKATDNFLGLVKEVSKQVSGHKATAEEWSVMVYPGSIGVGVLGGKENYHTDATREVIVSGLRSLANGIRPGEFTDNAIEYAKSLASLFKRSKIEPNVRIWSKTQESVRMERKIASAADNLLAAAYEEEGAVDGILERVDGHNRLQFVIYDLIDDRAVKCEISENLLQQALQNFQKRVEVIGAVRYRKDGMPVGIKAARIINFPDKSEIPSLAQMRALLSNGNAA
ncbi:MAG: hypothetical protein ACYCY8_06360 [Burkholderiales bacterium]